MFIMSTDYYLFADDGTYIKVNMQDYVRTEIGSKYGAEGYKWKR